MGAKLADHPLDPRIGKTLGTLLSAFRDGTQKLFDFELMAAMLAL